MYEKNVDRDACGIGFVADTQGQARPEILELALEGLRGVGHRGAMAADAKTSDGAGLLLPFPQEMFCSLLCEAREEEGEAAVSLDERPVGVAMVFLSSDAGRLGDISRLRAREALEAACVAEGLEVLGWRSVPVEIDRLGRLARCSAPSFEQMFFRVTQLDVSEERAEIRAYCARKRAECAMRGCGHRFYVASMSFHTIVYKALSPGDALATFYPDLRDERFSVEFGIFHMRFSTNTAPSWERAQPYRHLCHNGEINAITGNHNRMIAREGSLGFPSYIQDESVLIPVLDPETSDSGKLDATVELLVRGGRSVEHAMLMLLPEAWEVAEDLPPAVIDFYRYHACVMEPWDGPAGVIATDGRKVVARLDRNGLRPLRWSVADNSVIVVCSEVGAVDLSERKSVRRGRLGPGEMLLVHSTAPHVAVPALPGQSAALQQRTPAVSAPGVFYDQEVKDRLAEAVPYGKWVEAGLMQKPVVERLYETRADLLERQAVYGYTTEDLSVILKTMVLEGKEPVFAMGDDTPLPNFSSFSRPIHHYLKQAFAQVTNPPIDHIRERLVMSLRTCLGPRDALLSERLEAAQLVESSTFFLSPSGVKWLTDPATRPFEAAVLDATFQVSAGEEGMRAAVLSVCDEAVQAIHGGVGILVLTDMGYDRERVPIPILLVLGAVQHHLVQQGLRMRVSLIVDTDEVRDSHHMAALLGYGADAVCPRLALESVVTISDAGGVGHDMTAGLAQERFQAAIEDGVRKIMSKMGISTVDSYRGAQIFEAIGLGQDVMELCFSGTPSRLGGISLQQIASEVLERHASALYDSSRLVSPGLFRYRRTGEYHANNPEVVERLHQAIGFVSDREKTSTREKKQRIAISVARSARQEAGNSEESVAATTAIVQDDMRKKRILRRKDERGQQPEDLFPLPDPPRMGEIATAHKLQASVRVGDIALYEEFASLVNGRPPTEVHDLLEFAKVEHPLSVTAVAPASHILRRFSTGAMSHGALSREAHETLALAMNMVGGRSNCGEGGEARDRFFTKGTARDRNSAMKQIASGRFGVTPEYCVYADEIQIKMAQGSKPGEGGQIPGHKVTEEIARLRRTQPGVTLISPPPHHDIYSIEDLAQLIFDLKQVNKWAEVAVKLVSVYGVGTIAAGVVKAFADAVHISGCTGGTGASALSSIKHAGMPWELGLAEAHQVLTDRGLRNRVRLSVDGGFKTGRDVVIAALLGADEFAFGTAALIAEGCIMVRACNRDTCPAGIATQRPHLRSKFAGTPEMVAFYMECVAGEVRSILASLGLSSLEEATGRTDLLWRRFTGDPRIDAFDVSPLLNVQPYHDLREVDGFTGEVPIERRRSMLGDQLAADAFRPLWEGDKSHFSYKIRNSDRTVGAALGGAVALEFGEDTPPGHVTVQFDGSAGQSFGAFLTRGVELVLTGEANDYVGKAMTGGRIVIRPPQNDAGDPCLMGNTVLYGATGGQLFCAGSAGERFAVRNSGAIAVVEGVGLHCAEYMTGGTILVLGSVGANMGAGMTGGEIFIHGMDQTLFSKVNFSLVRLVRPDFAALQRVRSLLECHFDLTASVRAEAILAEWERESREFHWALPVNEVDRTSLSVSQNTPANA